MELRINRVRINRSQPVSIEEKVTNITLSVPGLKKGNPPPMSQMVFSQSEVGPQKLQKGLGTFFQSVLSELKSV